MTRKARIDLPIRDDLGNVRGVFEGVRTSLLPVLSIARFDFSLDDRVEKVRVLEISDVVEVFYMKDWKLDTNSLIAKNIH